MKCKMPLWIILIITICFLTGCSNQAARMDKPGKAATLPPEESAGRLDVPPEKNPEHKNDPRHDLSPYQSPVTDEDSSNLIYHAKLDRLRLMICTDEEYPLNGQIYTSTEGLQAIQEHFSNLGFRVVEGLLCPDYKSNSQTLSRYAERYDIDLFILATINSKLSTDSGGFYTYRARGRAKAAQISDTELVTTKSTSAQGKDSRDAQYAADSSLMICGSELAAKISDEILRKSDRGILLRKVIVSGLSSVEQADYIRTGLASKDGIKSVVSKTGWNQTTKSAVFWVYMDAWGKENLPVYLENLDKVKLTVTGVDNLGANSQR